MKLLGTRRLIICLGVLAGLLVGWNILPLAREFGLDARVEEERAQIERAVAGFEESIHREVARLDRVLDDAARRLSTSEIDVDPDKDPKGELEARAMLEAIQPAISVGPAAVGTTLLLYDAGATTDGLSGRVTQAGIELEGANAAGDRLTAATVERLVRASPLTGWVLPNPMWVWFEPDGTEGVRITRAMLLHEYLIGTDEAGKEPELLEAVYLLTASAPVWVAPNWRVGCDIVEGTILATPHWRGRLGTPVTEALMAEALVPGRGAWQFPSTSLLPRASLEWYRRSHSRWHVSAVTLLLGLLLSIGVYVLRRRTLAEGPSAPPDVTAEAAHEMRTPLTVMRGALEVALRRERSPQEYRETLTLCLEEVRGLQNLQDAVLFLGRGARVEPAREPVDLLGLAEGEVSRLRGMHVERQIVLDASGEPLVVTGDPSLLARLLGNLLDNAALHSTPGGAVRVALACAGAQAVVTVEDDGPGVPPARRERIFERFYRGPEASRRGVPGSGLGLPIARWLAELHGGALTLDPEPTDRARFRLTLPLR